MEHTPAPEAPPPRPAEVQPPTHPPAQPEAVAASATPIRLDYQPALHRIARRVNDEQLTCQLLVALAALVGWGLGFLFALNFTSVFLVAAADFNPLSFLGSEAITAVSMLSTLALSAVVPAAIVGGALYIYRERYKTVTADLVWGNMALTLLDENYGAQVEELRQSKYKPIFGIVHLGNKIEDRLIHFAYYYSQYYRLSRGPSEPQVPAVTPLNCWIDGGLLMLCGGSCALLFPLFALRILLTYPRVLATKRAALDFLAGKWDVALEQQYVSKARLVRSR